MDRCGAKAARRPLAEREGTDRALRLFEEHGARGIEGAGGARPHLHSHRPGGGAYLQQVSVEHASEPLRNFLHFHHLDGHHIYQLRKALEPELAVSVVGRLTPAQFEKLEDNVRLCTIEPTNEDELRMQREAELAFHTLLAESCPNPVLSFMCRFLNDLLRDLVVYKKALDHHHFGEANVDYHTQLLAAYRKEDAEEVRRLMSEHMVDAEQHMHEMEAHIGAKHLLLPSGQR
jgi:GntR family transcriptional repressor for pyruvate dehydrogenase complex